MTSSFQNRAYGELIIVIYEFDSLHVCEFTVIRVKNIKLLSVKCISVHKILILI